MSDEIRWGVFKADLGSGMGSEQAGQRPVLVISNDSFNAVMPVVTILPITSLKPGRKIYPAEVLVQRGEANLLEDSIVLSHQIRTISRKRLNNAYGYIETPEIREKVESALKTHLDLE